MAMLVRLVATALVCLPLATGQTLQWFQWYQGLCPIGQVPYIDPLQNRPSLCSTISQVCPLGYTCQRGSGTSQASALLVCCAPSGTCATGGQIYRDVTGAIPSCAPNVAGNCPPSFICAPGTTSLGQYLCCGGGFGGGAQCPGGGIGSGTCQVGSPFSTCPLGQTCQHSLTGIGVCCSGGIIGGTCPNGAPSSGICSQLQPTCFPGSTCTQTISGFACCQGTTTATCPSGQPPAPAVCVAPGSQCQLGYICQQTLTGQLACCPGGTSTGTCPNGGAPIAGTCVTAGAACQNGYTCQQTLTGIACCPTGIVGAQGQCPSGYTVAISAVDGTPRTCTGLIDLTCPLGFSCLQSTTPGAYLCCQLGTTGKKR